ncbi:uncharacterized protein LOC117335535 [Pecten maximus]|uniref:uncharacterized protein LOC117335535 n=1 Tax=Pecten maximus TaxID=6579 RepID=UPI00145917DE|nr:uncharacterized protein LOC117335535 [Pecten maximus]XP_033751497.1 uncharacterized protein LOC117335535 [Pecten maximus]
MRMASASDEKLSRNKSVTEPWITSPRKDENKKVESANETKDDTTDAKIIANLTPEPSDSSNVKSNEDVTSKSSTDNNESVKTDANNDDVKQSSLPTEKPEQEVQSQENASEPNKSNSGENNKEIKPKIVGNVIETKSVPAKSNGLAQSNAIVDIDPINDDDVDMYDPELLITEEESKAFDHMIEQRRDEIVKDKAKFEKWVDSITRRRMFALSRLRKLGKCHGERFKLYGKVQDYVKEVESVLSSASSTRTIHSGNKNSTSKSSKPTSASSTTYKTSTRGKWISKGDNWIC